MDARLERFRSEAQQVGDGAGRKFPRALVAEGGAYARARRDDGASWKTIAAELGVIAPTVQRWAKREDEGAAEFHRVSVVEREPRGVYTAVLPGGLRIEGLEFDAVVALAKALS